MDPVEPPAESGLAGEDARKGEFLVYFSKERLRIYAFIFSLLHNSTDTEDLFQQTSITLWKKFDEFDKDRSFFSWACGVAYREVQNFRRLAVHRRFIFDNDLVNTLVSEHVDNSFKNRYQLDLLDECIANLNDTDTEILTRVYHDKWAVREVAESLDRATQTVYNRLNTIRSTLLDCVQRKMKVRSV